MIKQWQHINDLEIARKLGSSQTFNQPWEIMKVEKMWKEASWCRIIKEP